MLESLRKHMCNSPVMITIMENAYIYGAHICSRHLIRLYTLYLMKPTNQLYEVGTVISSRLQMGKLRVMSLGDLLKDTQLWWSYGLNLNSVPSRACTLIQATDTGDTRDLVRIILYNILIMCLYIQHNLIIYLHHNKSTYIHIVYSSSNIV